jgi:ATP-dependent Clp endopeptidase proteolytic subunit ClpP
MRMKALAQGFELAIYGDISCEDGSAREFRDERARAGGDPVTLYINSEGGDIFEGLAIYNEMLAYSGEITVRVMSIAGSAASIIAMGGDRIEMAPNAQMMIHQAWVGAQGNADELEALIPTLRQIDTALVETYVARTGQPEEAIRQMLSRDTYMSAQKCVELGFADEIISAAAARPMARNKTRVSRSVPEKFAALRRRQSLSRLAALARSASASL